MSNIVSPLGTYTLLMCVYVSGLRQVGMHWSDVQLGLPYKVFPGIARNTFFSADFFLFLYIFFFFLYSQNYPNPPIFSISFLRGGILSICCYMNIYITLS